MAHRFDYGNSDAGVITSFDYLFLAPEFGSLIPSTALFLGAGQETGSVTWPGGSQDSHLSSSGAIATGTVPDPLFSRAALAFAVPAEFDAATDFTGLYGGVEGQAYVLGYMRLFGQAMPVFSWDATATGADRDAALADFAANRDAAIADVAAQIQAVLDATITGQITTAIWGLVATGEPDQITMTYTPDVDTALTYDDLLDLLIGPDGRMTLVPDAANEFNLSTVFAPTETVEVILTAFDDDFAGDGLSAGAVWIDAGAGNDTVSVFGSRNADDPLPGSITLLGGDGDDVLDMPAAVLSRMHGGTGHDTVTGGTLSDYLAGDAGNDSLTGGTGTDTLVGGTGNDLLDGGTENDRLEGGRGHDTLLGGAARDRLLGGLGNDRLVGGTGNDFVTGGNGADTFVFAAGDGRDRVTDLTLLDRIELSVDLWSGSVADFVAARVVVHGPDELRMNLSGTGFVVFDTTLDASDLTGLILFV